MKDAIYKYLKQCPPAFHFFQDIEKAGDLYLIGGVLREFLDNGEIRHLRDIDIVIDIKDYSYWQKTLDNYSFKKNRFEGYKIICQDLLVDTWAIEETWAFRNHLVACTAQEYVKYLPETVFLNIDSIIYDWTLETWSKEKYQQAMNTRILDVVLPNNPQILLNIVRAFVLAKRYSMSFSISLQKIIYQEKEKSLTATAFVQTLFDEQLRRYQKAILTKSEIADMLERLVHT